jgi:hypothetical protein
MDGSWGQRQFLLLQDLTAYEPYTACKAFQHMQVRNMLLLTRILKGVVKAISKINVIIRTLSLLL